ncbi:hypothetical protein [Clostridium tarantellae]|uniref:hypothetical protein n=1 Tax=Clostridium tarantellae TaxID=39493 RepID=UPI001F20A502|nr:hypothetical protein [Clostridium tarantellae]
MFSNRFLNIFTNDMNLIYLAIPIIKIVVFGFPFVGILYTLITFMQVLGMESSASKLELMRQIVLLIPLIIVLPIIFSKFNIMSISPQLSVFFAMPISTIILVILYCKRIRVLLKS